MREGKERQGKVPLFYFLMFILFFAELDRFVKRDKSGNKILTLIKDFTSYHFS